MTVSNVEIDWMKHWGNNPHVVLSVDKLPKPSIYIKRGDFYRFHDEKSGFVNAFSYHSPGEGYGGRKFKIEYREVLEENGTCILYSEVKEIEMIGPWNPADSYLIDAGFSPSTSVTFKMNGNPNTLMGGSMEISKLEEILEKYFDNGIRLYLVQTSYGKIYLPHPTTLGLCICDFKKSRYDCPICKKSSTNSSVVNIPELGPPVIPSTVG